jgi:prolyl-tRNA editing enzyme YbaK/EbsC (Cys-tRNA(Pro) deacylase)
MSPPSPTRPCSSSLLLVHPSVEKVTRTLADLGATKASGNVRTLPAPAPTAVAAAEQLGVDVAQIANSLLFSADGTPLLVMASGGHRVDTAKVAAIVGAGKVERATPEFVREHTGFAIGGVAPVGHPAPLRTLVDVELQQYDEVWAAAGHPNTVFPTTYDELLAITRGEPAEIGQ